VSFIPEFSASLRLQCHIWCSRNIYDYYQCWKEFFCGNWPVLFDQDSL